MAMKIKLGLQPEWWEPLDAGGAKFLLAPLTQLDLHELRTHITMKPPGVTREGVEIVLKRCLKSWQNVEDGQGNDVPCTLANAKEIRSDILHLMAMFAINTAHLSEDDLKNSRAQLKFSETQKTSTAPIADAETDSPNGSDGE